MKYLVLLLVSISFIGNSQIDYSVKVTQLMALADDCDGGGLCLSAPQDPIFNIWVIDQENNEETYCWIFNNDDNQEYGLWNDIPDVEIAQRTGVVTSYISFDLGGFESDNLNPNCSSSFGDDEIFDRQFVEQIDLSLLQNGVPHIDTVSVGGVFFFEVEILYNDYASLSSLKNEAIDFSVYPNPSTGVLNIKINNQTTSDATILITDMMGREISSINAVSTQTTVDLSNQSSGVYFVSVFTENAVSTQRIVIK